MDGLLPQGLCGETPIPRAKVASKPNPSVSTSCIAIAFAALAACLVVNTTPPALGDRAAIAPTDSAAFIGADRNPTSTPKYETPCPVSRE